MRLLIIGQGGREHAFYTKFIQDAAIYDQNEHLIKVMPGNGGVLPEHILPGQVEDFALIKKYVEQFHFDTILVGPENPLVEGISDYFQDGSVFVFGPSKKAAMLEGSKAFAKDFMNRYKIPTASYAVFSEFEVAWDYVVSQGMPIVIKASGLAAGKGVTVCFSEDTARQALQEALSGQAFGNSGRTVVIESFLQGKEASLFAISDGKNFKILGTAQDYKRAYNNNEGPNTGGMGAFSPAKILNNDIFVNVMRQIVEPTFSGLLKDGLSYVGILYFGLMIAEDGSPYLIEYNCRMGDPEAQVVLPLVKTPLTDILAAAKNQTLDKIEIDYDMGYALTVVWAKQGYPGSYEKGTLIHASLALNPSQQGSEQKLVNSYIYHAGTGVEKDSNHLVSTGGRVLNCTGFGKTLNDAAHQAYQEIKKLPESGFFYRTDIGSDYF